jgi:hypothetical protein
MWHDYSFKQTSHNKNERHGDRKVFTAHPAWRMRGSALEDRRRACRLTGPERDRPVGLIRWTNREKRTFAFLLLARACPDEYALGARSVPVTDVSTKVAGSSSEVQERHAPCSDVTQGRHRV